MRARRLRPLVLAALVAVCLAAGGPTARAADFPANPSSLGTIPDGPGPLGCLLNERVVTVPVSGIAGPVTSVAATFTLNPPHTHVGDLYVSIDDPRGNSHSLFYLTGETGGGMGDSSTVTGPYTFSDSAPASPTWWQAAGAGDPIAPGSYRAATDGGMAGGGANTLITPTFAGSGDPNGTWSVPFCDIHMGDTGAVSAVTLSINGTSPPAATPATGQPAAPTKKCKKKRKKKRSASSAKGCKKKKKRSS